MGIQRDLPFLRALMRRIAPPAQTHLLIVDPDLASARALASALPKSCAVAFATTAAEARAAIAKAPPDVVATELHLPDAAGIDLLSSLRQNPATSRLLLMALATRTTVGEKVALFLAGADDCLIKPISPAIFAENVMRLALSRATLRYDAS